MNVKASVDQTIARQAARLKALKKIKGALAALDENDARDVLAELEEAVDLSQERGQ